MFSRTSIKLHPLHYRVINIATSSVQIHTFLNHNVTKLKVPIKTFQQVNICKFSQEAKEQGVVDYDYVKNNVGKNNVLIIDVREPDELKEHGYIPSSLNVPLGNVETALNMSESEFHNIFKRHKPTENCEIIFYCMIGKRSGKAQQSALNLGYKNAKNYLGSWTDWTSRV